MKSLDFSKRLAFLCFLGVLICYFLPWRFQVNDDVMMMWLVSGAYTGTPESFAVFIHPFLSYFLSQLYQWIPDFNWYGFFWLSTNGLSTFLLILTINGRNKKGVENAIQTLLILTISIHLSIFLQFTLVAGYAAFAALTTIWRNQNHNGVPLFISICLWIIAILIRWESAALIGIGFLWYLLIFEKNKILNYRTLLPFSLFLVLFISKLYWENSEEYQDFIAFNRNRSSVIDHPIMHHDIYSDKLEPNSDWFYFSRWLFEELPIGEKELIEKKSEMDDRLLSWAQVKNGIERFYWVQRTEVFKSFLMGIFLLLFFAFPASVSRKIIFFSFWILFYLAFNHFHLLLGRVNLLFFLVFMFPVLYHSKLKISKKGFLALSIVLIIFLAKHLFNFYNEYQERKIIQKELEALFSKKEKDIPIFLEGLFEFYLMEHYSYKNPVPVLTYGWISRSPFQKKAYERFGFSSQKDLQRFGLLSFQFPEPLQFPNYMSRISSEFMADKEVLEEYLRLTYYEKKDR